MPQNTQGNIVKHIPITKDSTEKLNLRTLKVKS